MNPTVLKQIANEKKWCCSSCEQRLQAKDAYSLLGGEAFAVLVCRNSECSEFQTDVERGLSSVDAQRIGLHKITGNKDETTGSPFPIG